MYVSRFPGGKLIDSDFSGIENRITAYLAKDKVRAEWLKDPKFSEHKYLVSKFFGTPYDEVEKSHDKDSHYAICKIIVHGSDRVMGARKISEQFDMDFMTVKKVQAAWKDEIRDTINWQRRVMEEAKRTGWVQNVFGRKLWLWASNSGPEAVSFYPQSTAADIMFRAMIGLYYDRINWPEEYARKVCPILCPLPAPALMIASVHDEILVDSPIEVAEESKNALQIVMSQPISELGGMIIPISIGIFDSWGDAEG